MHNQPINTNPIIQFIQQVSSADLSNQQEVRLTITNAKTLAYSLGIVMARLEGDLEKLVIESKDDSNQIIELQIGQGGNW
jgi:hypothetical protein